MQSYRITRLLMISFLLFLLLRTTSARAITYYVATSGSDSNPGTINEPFLTLQHGLTVAQNGDVVLVSPGVYSGVGNIDLDFGGKSLYLRSSNVQEGSVILDCQNAGRGFHFHSGETSSAVVNGLTITNAHAPDGSADPVTGNGTDGADGGGILIEGGSSPTICNCTFSNDSAGNGGSFILGQGYLSGDGGNGGAIYISGGSPCLQNCTFNSNSAGYGANPVDIGTYGGAGGSGGAIAINSGLNVVVRKCQFNGNTAAGGGTAEFLNDAYGGNGGSGGALVVSSSNSITIEDCLFSGNAAGSGGYDTGDGTGTAAGSGGGMEIDASSVEILRCTLSNNRAGASGATGGDSGSTAPGGAGGGIDANDSTVTITDCELTGNRAGPSGVAESQAGTGGLGGGIALNGGNGSCILRCLLLSNSAGEGGGDSGGANGSAGNGGNGGGISITNCRPHITDCILEGNGAGETASYSDNQGANGGNGGGIALQSGGDAVITNCVVASNRGGDGGAGSAYSNGNGGNGGGISVDGTSNPVIDNCTVAYNSSGAGAGMVGNPDFPPGTNGLGGGLFSGNASTSVTNSILYFDTDPSGAVSEIAGAANVSFADVQGSVLDRGNPRFVRKPGILSSTDPGDFQIQMDSPCIDVGDNAALPHGITTDLDGNPRIVNGIVDLGAYEFQRVTNVTGQITIERGGYRLDRATGRFVQTVIVTNTGGALTGPVSLVLDNLSSNVSLFNRTGVTSTLSPVGSPYIDIVSGNLAAKASVTITLEFTDPARAAINYSTRVLAGPGSR